MCIRNSPKECFVLFLTFLIVLILFPILGIFLIPIYLFRKVVKLLAKGLHPELAEMLSGYSSLMAARRLPISTDNRDCSMAVSFLMPGTNVNMQKVYEVAETILAKERFVKAKMTLVKWMGFYFWKHVPNTFELKSHFILHEDTITPNEFNNLVENDLLYEPYPMDRPVWEIHLYSKYIPEDSENETMKYANNSAVILKVHHSLADWFSLLSLLDEINQYIVDNHSNNSHSPFNLCPSIKTHSPKSNQKMKSHISTMNLSEKFFFWLETFLLGPFQVVGELILAYNTTIQSLTGIRPLKTLQSFEASVPSSYLKSIVKKHGVSIPALTFSGYVSALRKLFIQLGVNPLPERIAIVGPTLLPGARPKDLNNYYSAVPFQALVREEDAFKRLAFVNKEFQRLKTSPKPIIFHAFFSTLGALFHSLLEKISHTRLGVASLTIAPGPQDLSQSLGLKNVTDFKLTGSMPFGDVVMLGFYCASVSGQFELRITGDTALFQNPESAKQFMNWILEELQILDRKIVSIENV